MSKVCAIWHHTETWVLSLGRPEFRRKFNLESKKMLSILANCRKYVDSACSFEKLQFDRKIFRSRVRRALTAASRYHPQFAFEAANCRWKWQNYFGNLEWQFVSKFDVQETPYKYKPKFAPRLIIQICARSALSLITWLLYFFWRGKGKAKLMEDGAQEKLYEYKFKFASKPYHANLRTKQIVIDIMKLFENWGSKFFRRCYPSPF